MEYKDIKKLIDDMGNSKIDSLEIEFPDGIKISMAKNVNTKIPYTSVIEGSAPISTPMVIEKQETSLVNVKTSDEGLNVVKSPMVGTFYKSASPDKDAFVKVGDKVSKGQTLCIVEAMKLMNEIESEFDGEIVEVCVKDEDMVEFGTPLFKIK